MPLTEKEWDEWVALTNKIELGERLPEKAFYAKSAKLGVVSIELAVLRERGSDYEILLEQRPADDPFYAGQWHMDGTIITARESDAKALKRLSDKELAGLDVSGAEKLRTFDFPLEKRGPSHNQLHLLILSEHAKVNLKENQQWFAVNSLPEPMVAVHIVMLNWLRQYLSEEA